MSQIRPTPGRHYACNGKHSCNIIGSIGKNTKFISEHNKSGITITDPYIISTIVKTAHAQRAATSVYASNKINGFGRWEGAPGGSGTSLKNKF